MALLNRSFSLMVRVCRGSRAELRLYLLSIFSLAVAFVCLAATLLVVFNLQAVRDRWARAGRVSVYLRDDASEGDVAALKRALDRSPDLVSSRLVSPADARQELAAEGFGSSLATLPSEAFPASIELSVRPELSDAQLEAFAGRLRSLPSVEAVETYQRWTDKLGALLHAGTSASIVLALVVLGAVVSVITSTIRLALIRRRTEVEVLKLVGATDRFVRGPFVIEGAFQGALGAAGSLLLLGLLYVLVRERFDEELGALLGLSPTFLPWQAVVGLVAGGAALGAVAARAGVRRLLAAS
jgi:cell division transport system permease protein